MTLTFDWPQIIYASIMALGIYGVATEKEKVKEVGIPSAYFALALGLCLTYWGGFYETIGFFQVFYISAYVTGFLSMLDSKEIDMNMKNVLAKSIPSWIALICGGFFG